jgi:hypothetical protein
MRHVIIKDGRVDDVILVGWNYVAPEGQHSVPSDTANIGDLYDGTKFHKPAATKDALISHAHMRHNESPHASYRIGSVTVAVEAGDHEALARLAVRAVNDKTLTVAWPQPRHGGVTVPLSADQIIHLNDAVTDAALARMQTFAGLLDGIASGKVTHHGHAAPRSPS